MLTDKLLLVTESISGLDQFSVKCHQGMQNRKGPIGQKTLFWHCGNCHISIRNYQNLPINNTRTAISKTCSNLEKVHQCLLSYKSEIKCRQTDTVRAPHKRGY